MTSHPPPIAPSGAFHDLEPPMWGDRTRRALSVFAISRERVAPELIQSLAWVKLACARANVASGALCPVRGEAIEAAALELVAGAHAGQFPLSVWQSATGAQTHDNINEVIARRASELLDESSGIRCEIDPVGDVALGHDAEDAFPTAIHLAAMQSLNQRLLPALARLRGTLAVKSHYYRDCEALPGGPGARQAPGGATLGQSLGALETQLSQAQQALEAARLPVLELAIGARATDDARTDFAARVCVALAQGTGHAFRPAGDRFAAVGGSHALAGLHGALKNLAVTLNQVAQDVHAFVPPLDRPVVPAGRMDGLAPSRAGPKSQEDLEPTLCETLAMISAQVIGNDAALSTASASGALHGQAARPLLAHLLLQSLRLLADGMAAFDTHLMRGLTAPARSRRRRRDDADPRAPGVALREGGPDPRTIGPLAA